MANKKVQAQMQIDVSFVGNTTKLFKSLESSFSKLNLSSALTKQIESDLTKGFKDTFTNLNRMTEGLSKKGLNSKQYTNFFNAINAKVADSTKIFGTLKKNLDSVFNSQENKQALKDLETYKKQLAEINKIASQQKAAQTRQATAATKMKDETGLDYNLSKRMLNAINGRKNNKQDLTKNQQDWLAANGLDEAKLKRALELLKQINAQRNASDNANAKAKSITGQGGVDSSLGFLEKQINKAAGTAYSPADYKNNVAILEKYSQVAMKAAGASDVLEQEFGEELPRATAEAEKMAEGMQTLNEVLSQFGIVLSAGTIVRAFKDIVTSAFEFYKSLDSALNQIYVVSNLTSGAVDSLKTNFISMAKETGMALDDVTRSAVLFYQQGLNTDEVMTMTEVTSQFAKVAGIDATDAADKLTAAVNGYCLAAEDASIVADKFNRVAASSAADINELSTAFSKAAAQANQAGVSMDNYLAYIATMEEATREAPENIGTSLKTIFSRMQQVKEGGSSEDGETDVNKVETALKSVGIQLRDTENQLRDLEDIFDELGPKWNGLDRNTQAYLGTIIAGTRQQSRFITLMQNWDRVLELSEESANSAGQQALMHAKAMESIESKVQQFQVAWQEFISNIADSSVFKGVISSLTGLINKVNSGSKPLFLLSTAIMAVLKQVGKLQGPLTKLFGKFSGGIKSVTKLANVTNLRLAGAYIKSTKEIKKYAKENDRLGKVNEKLTKSIDEAKTKQEQIASQYGLTSEEMQKAADAGDIIDDEYNNLTQTINDNTQAIQNNRNVMNSNEEAMKKQVPDLEKQKQAFQDVSAGVKNLSVGFASLAMVTDGGVSSIMQLASTVLGFVGMAIPAIMELSATENTSIILLLVKLGPVILAGIVTLINLVKILGEALGNQDKKIAESVEKMGDALEKLNNAKAKIKGGESLIKEYETLSQKIYRTAAEQEKLNNVAQQLADSLDLDLIEDEFGNLSISLDQAGEKMYKLKEEAKEAKKELVDTEHEEIEKYDHNGNVGKFYDKYLKAHRSDIRNAMDDIETGLDPKEFATSANNVNTIMTNLKNNIIDSCNEMNEAYGGFGMRWSLTEDVESMINSFNNADIDNTAWNSLFQTFDVLQERVDNLSYDKALEIVEAAISSWGDAANLTTEQVQMMTDSIMTSLYGNTNLQKTIAKYDDILNKYNGTDFKTRRESYTKQKDDAWDAADNNGEWDLYNPFYKSDEEAEYEAAKKKLKLLDREESKYEEIRNLDKMIEETEGDTTALLEYRNQLAEKYGIASYEQLKEAQIMKEILYDISNNVAEGFDMAGLFDADSYEILKQWQDSGVLDQIENAFELDETAGKQKLTQELVNIINSTDDEQLKEVAQKKLDNVFKSIQIRGTMKWGELSDTLDDLSDKLRKMNSLMEDFKDTGGFTLDTFADLCDILDSIDMAAVFDAGKMDQYLAALENLELGFDASTGAITANGKALESLQDIQEVMTQAKLEATAQSLEADKASLQSQIYGIEAEIAANNALIQWLSKQSDVEIEIDKIKEQGQVDYNNTMQQAATLTAKQYQDMTKFSSTWAQASITNAAKVGEAIKKAMTGELGTGNLSAYLDGLVRDMQYDTTGSYNELLMLQQKNAQGKNVVNRDAAIKALQDYNVKGQNTIDSLYAQMKGIEQMQSLLHTMSKSDLSKLGSDGKGDSKDIDKYIGKLKEIYNILNRIQVLEHRLSTLDAYADIAQGQMYGDLLSERVEYNKELLDQYEFLTKEQKQFTNGYKDFIGSVEGLEGVFDFDKYGQIIINWEKYTALQDEAADGETTLKEKADDVYDTYTKMFEDLQGYFDETIKYYKAVIELEEEQVDAYIEMENKAAEAIKEIYQKILDTKLEAIDKEKEAIEDLRKAREDARKDQENAKAVSGLQTNIQRAMMDTSGASDSALIKAQNDLDEKLDAIAEDKYSEMLDDIIDKLDQEQNALQEEFDELWENLDWLFTWLDSDIMGNESALYSLLEQTDEWNQQSFLERQKALDEWKTKFYTYYDAITQNDKGIYGVYDNITATKERIAELDKNLQSSISKGSAEIAQTIGQWKAAQAAASSSGGSGGSGGGGSSSSSSKNYSTTSSYTPSITGIDSSLSNTSKTTGNDGFAFAKDAKVHSAVGALMDGYKYDKNGDLVTPPTQSGWDSNKLWTSGETMYVSRRKSYNGSNYYGLAFSKGGKPVVWANGHQIKYKNGGFADFTGPAWLDGTKQHPEAVLNALQTEHFIKFTDTLDKMYSSNNFNNSASNAINIGNIAFQVDSMSSPEDGEKAFNVFVSKFKEIGNQTGIKIDTFKNTL